MKAYIVQLCLLLAITPSLADFWTAPPVLTPQAATTHNFALTDSNFDQSLFDQNDKPWFIKFYAPWCHHCQALAPVWEGLAAEMSDVHFGEVNCVEFYGLCSRFQVQGFPTLLFAENLTNIYTFPVMMRTAETMKTFIQDTIKYHNTSASKQFPVNPAFAPQQTPIAESPVSSNSMVENTTLEGSSTVNSTTETSGNTSGNLSGINNTTPLPPTSPEQPTETGIHEANPPNYLPAGLENERISQGAVTDAPVTDAPTNPIQQAPLNADSTNTANPTQQQLSQNDYDLNTHLNYSNPASDPHLFKSTTPQQQATPLPQTGPFDAKHLPSDPRDPTRIEHPDFTDYRNQNDVNEPMSPTDQYMYEENAGVPPIEANQPAANPNWPAQDLANQANLNWPAQDFANQANPNVPTQEFTDAPNPNPQNQDFNNQANPSQPPQDFANPATTNIPTPEGANPPNPNIPTQDFSTLPQGSQFNAEAATWDSVTNSWNTNTFDATTQQPQNPENWNNNPADNANVNPNNIQSANANISAGLNGTENTTYAGVPAPAFNETANQFPTGAFGTNESQNLPAQQGEFPIQNTSTADTTNISNPQANFPEASGLPNESTAIGNQSTLPFNNIPNAADGTVTPDFNNTNIRGQPTENFTANATNAINQTTESINTTNDSAINNTATDKGIIETVYDATLGTVVNSVENLYDSAVSSTTDAATEKITDIANSAIDSAADSTSADVSGVTDAIKGTVSDVVNSTVSDFAANGTNMNLSNTASTVIDSVSNATNTNISGIASNISDQFTNASASNLTSIATEALDSLPATTASNLTDAAGNLLDQASNLTGTNITQKAENFLEGTLNTSNLSNTASNLLDQASNLTGSEIVQKAEGFVDNALNSSNLSNTASNLLDKASDLTGTNLTQKAEGLVDSALNTSNLSNTASNLVDQASNFTGTDIAQTAGGLVDNALNTSNISNTASNLLDQASNFTGTDIAQTVGSALNTSNISNTASNLLDQASNFTGTNVTQKAEGLVDSALNATNTNISDIANTATDLLNTTTATKISDEASKITANASNTGSSIIDTAVDKVKDVASTVAGGTTAGNMFDLAFNTSVPTANMTAANTTVETTEVTPVDPTSGTPKVPVDTTNTIPDNSTTPSISETPVTGVTDEPTAANATYEYLAGTVVKLTDKDFDSIIAGYPNKNPWFVKFYAPWCPHCQRLAPTWVDLAKELQDEVNVADVDCVENYDLRQRFSINGYPTLVMIVDNELFLYRGERSVEALKEFALNTKNFKNTTTSTAMPLPNTSFSVKWGVDSGRYNWLILPAVILATVGGAFGFIFLVYSIIVKLATRKVQPIEFAELNGESADIAENAEENDGKVGYMEDEHSKINIDTTRDTEGILTERAKQLKLKDKYGGHYDIEKGVEV